MNHKILFVDDRTKRIHWAIKHYLPPVWDLTLAVCVPEVLRLLSSQDFIVVSLDHDLLGHDFEDPETKTCGMEIVRYMEKCGGWHNSFPMPDFWIHSSNFFAANEMGRRLKSMGFNIQYKPIVYEGS